MAGHAHDQVLALKRLLADELPQAEANHFILIEIRGGQDLLMRYDGEIRNLGFVAVTLQANRLDGVSADLNSPCGFRCGHVLRLQFPCRAAEATTRARPSGC